MSPRSHRRVGDPSPPGARQGKGRRARFLGGVLLACLFLPACEGGDGASGGAPADAGGKASPAQASFPLRLTDATGAIREIPRPPTRIVSLVPSGTLTLVALGAQDLLVGRTDYDSLPSLAHLPSVGGGLGPSLERLVHLLPDLVLFFAGESDTATPARLAELGIPVFAIRPDGITDVREIIRQLGVLTGREGAADSLLGGMDATLTEVQSRVGNRNAVRVAYLLGGNPPWVAGGGSYIDEILTVAGGENVFRDLGTLYAPISPEELLVRRIDLLLAPEGADVRLPAVGLPLLRVSPELELPGPGLAQRALELAHLLHPEAFR